MLALSFSGFDFSDMRWMQLVGIRAERARRPRPDWGSGPNGRILDWRRIGVHSAGRYGHEAPVRRLGARKSATEHARFQSHNNKQEETWHA